MSEAIPSVMDNYQAAVTANPDNAEAHANLGWGWYGQRKFAEAMAAFEKAIALDGSAVDAHYGLGMAAKEAGAGERAVQAFEAAIGLAPKLENKSRAVMVAKLAQGHINQVRFGEWRLGETAKA